MNTFSLKRIKLLLLADWYELKEALFLVKAAASVVLFTGLFFSDISFEQSSLNAILLYMLFITFFPVCSYMDYRVHSKKGLGFLVPATVLEKFAVLIIIGLFFFACCFCLFFIALSLFSIYKLGYVSSFIYESMTIFSQMGVAYFVPFAFLATLFWLGVMSFYKNAPLKSLLILGGLIFLLVQTSRDFIGYLLFDTAGLSYQGTIYDTYHENLYPGILAVVPWVSYLLIPASLFVLYIGYLKLKEKEDR